MAASAVKYSSLAIILVLVGLAAHAQLAAAQNCSGGISRLAICAPFVVPGASNAPPSNECCQALSSIDNTCLCNTFDIIRRLPSTCKLPEVSCAGKLLLHASLLSFISFEFMWLIIVVPTNSCITDVVDRRQLQKNKDVDLVGVEFPLSTLY